MRHSKRQIYRGVKRILDCVFAIIFIAFLALPMALIWLCVRLDSPGGGFFRQIRVGRGGKLFVCYKFRTMYTSAPPCMPSSRFKDSERYVTRVGRLLRNSSLDELPQLFNVLKGDMSLVGPRPLVLCEREVHERRRENGVYALRPGITGLSQISGRNNITDAQKAAIDTEYLTSLCFLQDCKIIFKTVGKMKRD